MAKNKVKWGKRINIYLSNDVIGMIDILTGNRSRYIEEFIKKAYEKKVNKIKK